MERRTLAVWILSASFILGLLGQSLFYGKAFGISFPIFIGAIIVSVLALAKPANRPLKPRNLWTLIPLMFFASMVAVRGDSTLITLDVFATLALGALTLNYLPLEKFIDEQSTPNHIGAIVFSGTNSALNGVVEVTESWRWLRDKSQINGTLVPSIIRGLIFTVPILVMFAILLGSADLVFADYLNRLWDFFNFNNAEDLFARALLTVVLAWLIMGGMSFGLVRAVTTRATSKSTEPPLVHPLDLDTNTEAEPQETGRKSKPFRLGQIEISMILGSVNLLFIVFVLIQFAYLFGGREVIADGLTFSEYARRGFFELIAVSILVLGLVLLLDYFAHQGTRPTSLFQILSVVMVIMTCIMLFSAWRRMSLYEAEFGFTRLRVYTHIFMLWLAVLLGFGIANVFRVKKEVFSLGVLLVSIGYLGTLNLMNVDAYIANRNIDRFFNDGKELDVCYLRNISVDAVPEMIELYHQAENDEIREHLRWAFDRHMATLQSSYVDNSLSFNFGREKAHDLLNQIETEIEQIDSTASTYYYCDYTAYRYSGS